MHIKEFFPTSNRLLRAADVTGEQHETIAGITREEIGGEFKAVVSFVSGPRWRSTRPTAAFSVSFLATRPMAGLAKKSRLWSCR